MGKQFISMFIMGATGAYSGEAGYNIVARDDATNRDETITAEAAVELGMDIPFLSATTTMDALAAVDRAAAAQERAANSLQAEINAHARTKNERDAALARIAEMERELAAAAPSNDV